MPLNQESSLGRDVADQFHVVKNLLDATKNFLKRNIPETGHLIFQF